MMCAIWGESVRQFIQVYSHLWLHSKLVPYDVTAQTARRDLKFLMCSWRYQRSLALPLQTEKGWDTLLHRVSLPALRELLQGVSLKIIITFLMFQLEEAILF
jgi:hypothetical protein